MSDSLQALKDILPQTTTKSTQFSLIDMVTHGGPVGIFVMVCLFLLFMGSLYIFFERLFTIRKFYKNDLNLLNDIKDLIYEGKINIALDLCKRKHTPESLILYKGLLRIGKPVRDISDALENSAQLEIFKLEKNVGILGTISGAAPMLGFLGTVIGMIIAFFATSAESQASAQMLAGGIYSAMANTAAGLIVGLLAYLFYNILVIKIDKVSYSLQSLAVDFLDLLNKPVS